MRDYDNRSDDMRDQTENYLRDRIKALEAEVERLVRAMKGMAPK
jgi:hypothetical protein